QVTDVTYSLNPSETERAKILEMARSADAIVLGTYNAWQSQHIGQANLAQDLALSGANLVVVALRDPYDLTEMTDVSTYVATYGISPPQLQALAELLSGQVPGEGRLPVSIPGHIADE